MHILALEPNLMPRSASSCTERHERIVWRQVGDLKAGVVAENCSGGHREPNSSLRVDSRAGEDLGGRKAKG